MAYKVENFIHRATYTVGEAPHWEERTKSLLYVDLLAGDIHRYNTVTKLHDRRHIDVPCSLIVPRQNGGYIVTNQNNISHLDWTTGDIKTLATVEQGTKNKFNDGKCDETGRLWAGSMGPMLEPGKPEINAGSLYTLEKDLSVKRHRGELSISNGMAWNNDNTKFFYTDSFANEIWAYDFNLQDGVIANKQILVNQDTILPIGKPDGMTSDLHGRIWVAFFSGSCIVCFDQNTGQEVSRIQFPASQITSCCWGGENYDELFVTSAAVQLQSVEEEAGTVFRVTGLGTKGKPAANFSG